MAEVTRLLESLEAAYGAPAEDWPEDPYLFLIWWHCGYPASDAACTRGWESLRSKIGVEPERLLAADSSRLAQALKPGGMAPELRAMRLKDIAQRTQQEFEGNLAAALRAMPLPKARAALKKFPGIADPGADRILLFGHVSPVAAVPSNCPHVLVRMVRGWERENYGVTYKEAQQSIAEGVPANFDARKRAYSLLKRHGQETCKRTNPKCGECKVADWCAFAAGKGRGRASLS